MIIKGTHTLRKDADRITFKVMITADMTELVEIITVTDGEKNYERMPILKARQEWEQYIKLGWRNLERLDEQ